VPPTSPVGNLSSARQSVADRGDYSDGENEYQQLDVHKANGPFGFVAIVRGVFGGQEPE
jgi:hypothetical protein